MAIQLIVAEPVIEPPPPESAASVTPVVEGLVFKSALTATVPPGMPPMAIDGVAVYTFLNITVPVACGVADIFIAFVIPHWIIIPPIIT